MSTMQKITLPDMSFVESKPIRRRFSVRTPAGKRSETWVNVVHTEDPKEALLRKIGPIPEGLVQFSRILVAVYHPPIIEKTGGGIFISQAIQDDDRMENTFQGKVGLIVAMGPMTYVDDDSVKFHGTKNQVGDWVWFRPSDGMGCDVSEVFCRVLTERDIIGKLPHPDMVV